MHIKSVSLQEVIFDIVHHLEDFLRDRTQPPVSLHEEMVIRHQQEVDEQKRRDEEKRLQSEKEVGPTETKRCMPIHNVPLLYSVGK